MALKWLLFSVNNVLFSNLKVYTSVNITLIDIKHATKKCSVSLASFFFIFTIKKSAVGRFKQHRRYLLNFQHFYSVLD